MGSETKAKRGYFSFFIVIVLEVYIILHIFAMLVSSTAQDCLFIYTNNHTLKK